MKSIFGILIVGMALLMGCATPPGPGESHSGMDWLEEAKRVGLKGDPVVVALVRNGPYAGAGEYPGAIEWSEEGTGFSFERVEVVLTDEELAFLWWNQHLNEMILLDDYSLPLFEIDRITIEEDPDIEPDGYSPNLEAFTNALDILSLNLNALICNFNHFYVESGDKVVQFTTEMSEKKSGPILDSLVNDSGIEIWEKDCDGPPEQRTTKKTPAKVIKT